MDDVLIDAIDFVQAAHSGQIRKKNGLPYVSHLYSVTLFLESCGCSDQILLGSLCHDLLEKTSVSPTEIKRRYGAKVLRIVRDCSDRDELPWKERKQEALQRYQNAREDARSVYLADKLDGVRTLIHHLQQGTPEVFCRYYKRPLADHLWFFRSTLKHTPADPETSCFRRVLDRYRSTMDVLERLYRVQSPYTSGFTT